MNEIRLTILRDKPAPDILKKYAGSGYYLYRDRVTEAYFLTEAVEGRFKRSVFWSGYDRLLTIPCDFDWSYLKVFKAEHKDIMVDALIHDEIVIDAIALSQEFSTRVLCVYSNDEACDFAVTAENGKLLRLRFKAGSKQEECLPDEIAREIQTEIQATRILFDGEDPDNEGVYKYTGYEAIQTSEDPLSLQPYWEYHEGEIGGQVVFKTIKSISDKVSPNLLFRNAFLEFEEAFGQKAPDFTDIEEQDRYELIDFQPPPKASIFKKLFNLVKSLFSKITSSPKAILVTAIMAIVISGAIFGDKTDRTKTQKRFDENCSAAGGLVSGDKGNQCLVDNILYKNWNLLGKKDEQRAMLIETGPQKIPCPDLAENMCLDIEGEAFPYDIEGFTFKQGIPQTLAVIRTQICDPELANDCAKDGDIYRFKQVLSIEK